VKSEEVPKLGFKPDFSAEHKIKMPNGQVVKICERIENIGEIFFNRVNSIQKTILRSVENDEEKDYREYLNNIVLNGGCTKTYGFSERL
jgi:actin-related protein